MKRVKAHFEYHRDPVTKAMLGWVIEDLILGVPHFFKADYSWVLDISEASHFTTQQEAQFISEDLT